MKERAAIFSEWFGLKPAAGRIADALYEASGEVVSYPMLAAVAGITLNSVHFNVKLLRAAMEPGAIGCRIRRGYYLTAAGIEDCAAAVADAMARAAA